MSGIILPFRFLLGAKSEAKNFPGAVETLTLEAMVQDESYPSRNRRIPRTKLRSRQRHSI